MNMKPDQLEDTIVKESQVKPKLPKNYKVILLNDDYTPYGICGRSHSKGF
jgi:ATP-dependent Clp protease adapter protein ClpS